MSDMDKSPDTVPTSIPVGKGKPSTKAKKAPKSDKEKSGSQANPKTIPHTVTSQSKTQSQSPQDTDQKNTIAGGETGMNPMLKAIIEENKKIMASMFQSFRDEFTQSQLNRPSENVQPTDGVMGRVEKRSGKFDYRDQDSDSQGHDSSNILSNKNSPIQAQIDLHPNYEAEGLEDYIRDNPTQDDKNSQGDSLSDAGTATTVERSGEVE